MYYAYSISTVNIFICYYKIPNGKSYKESKVMPKIHIWQTLLYLLLYITKHQYFFFVYRNTDIHLIFLKNKKILNWIKYIPLLLLYIFVYLIPTYIQYRLHVMYYSFLYFFYSYRYIYITYILNKCWKVKKKQAV